MSQNTLEKYEELKKIRKELIEKLESGRNSLTQAEIDSLTKEIRALKEMIEIYEEFTDVSGHF